MPERRIIGYRFRPAPGWDPKPEEAPDDWFPPEGWTPPAHWPPAPQGWDFAEPVYEEGSEEQDSPAPPAEADSDDEAAEVTDLEVAAAPTESDNHEGAEEPEDTDFEPLAPLPVRSVPTLGAKKFAEGLLGELAEWHAYAGKVKRRLHHREQKLRELGGMSLVEVEARRDEVEISIRELVAQRDALSAEIADATASLADVRDRVELASDGLHAYEHPAESSLDLQTRLTSLQSEIKAMVRSKTAVIASSTFTFNNSVVEGRRWVADVSKLMLRAFNAEAENCVKTVRAGNLAAAQRRLALSVEQIAKLGARMGIYISPSYERLRMEELQVAAEYQERLKQEREAERQARGSA